MNATAIFAMVAAMLVTTLSAPASASTCNTPGCGGVVTNHSTLLTILISNNWCWSDRSTDVEEHLPCAPNHNVSNSYRADFELPRGATSESYYYYYDTDAIRMYRGCRTMIAEGPFTFVYDRTGLPSMWVKISNGERWSVVSEYC
jgi:hypothetical protein